MRAAGANEDHPANAFPSHESAGKLQSRYFEKERQMEPLFPEQGPGPTT